MTSSRSGCRLGMDWPHGQAGRGPQDFPGRTAVGGDSGPRVSHNPPRSLGTASSCLPRPTAGNTPGLTFSQEPKQSSQPASGHARPRGCETEGLCPPTPPPLDSQTTLLPSGSHYHWLKRVSNTSPPGVPKLLCAI